MSILFKGVHIESLVLHNLYNLLKYVPVTTAIMIGFLVEKGDGSMNALPILHHYDCDVSDR